MDELTKLTDYCRRLGASSQQAAIMAQQLLKRAEQLAVERNQSREESMAYLLSLTAQGNAGQVPVEFSPREIKPPTQNKASSPPK